MKQKIQRFLYGFAVAALWSGVLAIIAGGWLGLLVSASLGKGFIVGGVSALLWALAAGLVLALGEGYGG